MKSNTFTKALLTIIAVNLCFLSINELEIIPKVRANNQANSNELFPLSNYGLVPLNEDGSINVRLSSYDELDVNITDINTSDKLNVEIKEVDSYAFYYCTVPVRVE